ncbi:MULTISPECIES: hypothetical protein [unclassified Streptomyces]|uniref:hypothetical protein n=1 Tax=unclassified Streptomyces TaxID=2593676 RepID=UPI003657D977
MTVVSGAALFLLGVNTTGINTTLRAMAADLGVGTASLGWAVGAYVSAAIPWWLVLMPPSRSAAKTGP